MSQGVAMLGMLGLHGEPDMWREFIAGYGCCCLPCIIACHGLLNYAPFVP